MDNETEAKLEAAGFKKTIVAEFLELSPVDMALIETNRALRKAVRNRRAAVGISQAELANRMGSSQSRIAKLEGGDPKTSVDLMFRALFVMDATPQDVADIIASANERVSYTSPK